MYRPTLQNQAEPFAVFHRRLNRLERAVLWLAAGAALAVHAQTPRQMEEQQIFKRGKPAMMVVRAPAPRPQQPPPILKPEPAPLAAVPAPLSRPVEPQQTANRDPVVFVAAPAPLPKPTPPIPRFLPYDQSDNAFQVSPNLPADLRRVAVLPLVWEGTQSDLSQGAEVLGPLLLSELGKTKKFEIVSISPGELRSLTGRQSWTGAEILPADFFDSLQRVYGCDAVLFCQLSTFRAYAPLVVGWRMKLVDARTGQILWAVDKIFDAEQPGVLRQARHFHIGGQWVISNPANDWQVENSPRQFGQFALAQALSTLPNRKEMTKVSPPATDVPSRR